MAFTESNFEPETSPGYQVRLIHQMSAAAIERVLPEEGMTATQWMALVSIHFGHADTCVALARALSHDKGAMTRVLDQLEANGWIERRRDSADRRVVRLSLTGAGQAAAIAGKRKVIACWNHILDDWTDREVADLVAMLQRLRRTMEAKETCAG